MNRPMLFRRSEDYKKADADFMALPLKSRQTVLMIVLGGTLIVAGTVTLLSLVFTNKGATLFTGILCLIIGLPFFLIPSTMVRLFTRNKKAIPPSESTSTQN